jgi:hypothetical protein
MKKSAGVLFIVSFFAGASFAQVEKLWGDPHVVEKFYTEARKDPAYLKLKAQAAQLSNDARGTNTNAAAARALFTGNTDILKNLYQKSGIGAPQPMKMHFYNYSAPVARTKASSFLIHMTSIVPLKTKTATPPYKDDWEWDNQPLGNIMPDTSSSIFSNAKTVIFYGPPQTDARIRMGQYFKGYFHQVTVPSDPLIVAAEVKFEYSYIYTGWDTYGARLGIDMIVQAKNLNGSAYNALPGYDSSYSSYDWKYAATLYPAVTIDTEFGEFHSSGNSSFSLEGYVIPGTAIDLRLGLGFIKNTVRGLNGSYHYAEFILKKITVKYFKSAN